MTPISDRDGELLVRSARAAVTEFLMSGRKMDPPPEARSRFSFNAGVFVTISRNDELRGCIGYPTPDRKLFESLLDAAVASATEDPRFLPLEPPELGSVSFEVSVLTAPEVVRVDHPSQYPSAIKVGRDGLVVRWRYGSGLLLPQVPVEYGWNEEEFLSHTCQKAGAPLDCWRTGNTTILKFEGIIFRETSPSGPVVRAKL
ncbi:MAG: TIGR00296 family protein [Thaumarchaeota archaeon]|nr:TIGR00296 family protein [Nitrososphaerota archaeon]